MTQTMKLWRNPHTEVCDFDTFKAESRDFMERHRVIIASSKRPCLHDVSMFEVFECVVLPANREAQKVLMNSDKTLWGCRGQRLY